MVTLLPTIANAYIAFMQQIEGAVQKDDIIICSHQWHYLGAQAWDPPASPIVVFPAGQRSISLSLVHHQCRLVSISAD